MTRPISIVSLEDVDPSLNKISMGIYGHPGIGKTRLLGTGGPETLIMDSDSHGTVSAKRARSKAHKAKVTDYTELAEMYDFLAHDKHDFTWVWWDSITLFQDRGLIDDILVDAHLANPRQSEDVASQREYLVSQNRIGQYVRQFVDLPNINFGWTAHVMVGEDTEGDGGIIYKPAISGKRGTFSSYICGYMNIVAYMGLTPEGHRRLITQRTGEYYAKDRFHALRTNDKAYVQDVTLPQITQLVGKAMGWNQEGATALSPQRRRQRRTAS